MFFFFHLLNAIHWKRKCIHHLNLEFCLVLGHPCESLRPSKRELVKLLDYEFISIFLKRPITNTVINIINKDIITLKKVYRIFISI